MELYRQLHTLLYSDTIKVCTYAVGLIFISENGMHELITDSVLAHTVNSSVWTARADSLTIKLHISHFLQMYIHFQISSGTAATLSAKPVQQAMVLY